MDKQLIDIAHEMWAAAQLVPGEGIEDGANRIATILERIDAERGKEAVAFRMIDDDDVEYNGIDRFSCGRTGGEPLFLSPTIPENMVLVPVIPTPAMCAVISNEHDIYGSAQELYAMVLQAAQ